jgi:hypothetical protein
MELRRGAVLVFGTMDAALSRLSVKLAAMFLLAVAAIAAWNSVASAHLAQSAAPRAPEPPAAIESAVCCEPRAIAPAPSAPSDPTAGIAIAIFGFAILLALTLWHGRILTLALILALAILTYETGVHSVHHLGSPADASQCAIAGATTHLHGTVDEPQLTLGAPAYAGTAPVAHGPACRVLQTWRAWRGRAPPFSSIA